jgi:hypothetical protein
VAVKKIESAPAVDFVAAVEVFDIGAIGNAEAGVEAADLGEFGGDPFVRGHTIVVAALNHEGTRGHEGGELGVIEGVGLVEIEVIVFAGENIGGGEVERDDLAGPVVEGRRTNRDGVSFEKRRNTHGGGAAVGKAVEADAA